jgi:hypothetical protein
MTIPAAGITSVGLQSDAHGAKVFAAQLREFYHDIEILCHLPGPAKNLAPRRGRLQTIPARRYQ